MTSRGSQEDSNVINPNENVSNSPEQMKGIKKKTNSKSPCTNSTNSDITNSDELDKTQKSETSVSAKK
ncbi:Hypothetical protein SRAE_2000309500 [Strongyloides ratti]|uniref:Uncharacterized protein n=1 Tax=Strongyloides ratti TaxID=34506 RepID=A0A090LJX6_STRRB|nr:Hypothetical protein SRAE_2000309500 [Strongyloides ratti]CEF68438.1 Hypothetical protein SRAE_2000309500 [Strongyloides ratti]